MQELREELRQDFRDEDYAYAYVEDFLNAEIATQIKVLREQRDCTQQQLAERAGMQQPRLSLLEDVNYGAWSIKTLKKLARALDVTLKVSFESFGSRINDIANFKREALQRPTRIESLHSSDAETPKAVLDMLELVRQHLRQGQARMAEPTPSANLPAAVVGMFEWAKDRNQPPHPRAPLSLAPNQSTRERAAQGQQ